MPRMEFEREFEYKTYKTKKEISDHKDLLAAIIAFVQAYRCIFPNKGTFFGNGRKFPI